MKYKKYPSYKDSGIEWLGEIPEHWKVLSLKRLLSKVIDNRGRTPSFGSTGIPMLEIRNITKGIKSPTLEFEKFVEKDIVKEYERDKVQVGDLLISTVGATSGKAVIINEPPSYFIAQNIVGFRVNRLTISDYLYYFLCSDYFFTSLMLINKGNTIDNLKVSVFINNKCFLPPLLEQQQIANFLDNATAKIDTLIEKQTKLIELLKEKRQVVISHAVTKGLDPDVKMKDSGVEWLGEIPEHWSKVSMKWISNIYAGGTPDKSNLSYWTDGTVPWINSGEVNQFYILKPTTYITQEAYVNSSAKWIEVNSLVMALAGQGKTKGMVARLGIRTTCNQSMAAIETISKYESRFLLWWITSNYQRIRNMAGGDLRDGLNLDLLGNIPCPFMSLTEQQVIADYLDDKTLKIDKLVEKANKSIELLKEKRTALISSAVTGKIDVREMG